MSGYQPRFESKYYQPNQLTPELVGLHARNPLFYTNSPSRNAMMASHLSQRLTIHGAQEPIIQSLVESDWANYTFSVRMPENGRIMRMLDRYPVGVTKGSIQFNPEKIVIYEKDMGPGHKQDGEIDMFRIPYHASFHQYFGFKYKPKDAMNLISYNAYIPKDTIFANTPAVSDDGGLMDGLNLNTACMSIPGVEEDGFVVCSDVLPRMAIDIFDTRPISFGSKMFPLNSQGSSEEYKAFPDIGDDLRPDGLLMMLRNYDIDIAPVIMSVMNVKTPDYYFDKGLYARGGSVPIEQLEKEFMKTVEWEGSQRGAAHHQSLGRVVDIKVITNNSHNKHLPDGMRAQIDKYAKAYRDYLKSLTDAYFQILAERKKKYGNEELKISPEFSAEISRAATLLDLEHKKFGHSINLQYRKTPIDEVYIEFTIQYRIIPTNGFKLSDFSGA